MHFQVNAISLHAILKREKKVLRFSGNLLLQVSVDVILGAEAEQLN